VGKEARFEAGLLLRRLQRGERLGMPHSRPMPSIGPRAHELRVRDGEKRLTWRIFYRTDPDAILVVHWFAKKSRETPKGTIDLCRARLREYDDDDDQEDPEDPEGPEGLD
jgi:phage-related protein